VKDGQRVQFELAQVAVPAQPAAASRIPFSSRLRSVSLARTSFLRALLFHDLAP
jgi:hypothetical protein